MNKYMNGETENSIELNIFDQYIYYDEVFDHKTIKNEVLKLYPINLAERKL